MVMMVVMLSVAALGAASLGAFLVLSGFRNISSADQTMNSIMTADTGIECILFREFGHSNYSAVTGSGYCPAYGGSGDSSSITTPGNNSFYFALKDDQANYADWASTGSSEGGKTKRVLWIRFNKRI